MNCRLRIEEIQDGGRPVLKTLSCPHCLSSVNLVLIVDFKNKKPEKAVCVKRYVKPAMVRKFHKVTKNGCGEWFKLARATKGAEDGQSLRHIHEKTIKAS